MSPKFRWMVRFVWLVGLAALTMLAQGLMAGAPAYAAAGDVPPIPVPLQSTDYPGPEIPTVDTDYPIGGEEETPDNFVTPDLGDSTEFPEFPIEPEETLIPPDPATQGPDVFETENAEMQEAQVTPPPGGAPGPTITPVFTETVAPTSPAVTRTPAAPKKQGGGGVDWGMFWIGFSMPVLAACGVVLYLLDRRPDLFRSSRR